MRCQFCDGGKIDWPTLIDGRQHTVKIDCHECGGTGHLHCCEGLREQPERHLTAAEQRVLDGALRRYVKGTQNV